MALVLFSLLLLAYITEGLFHGMRNWLAEKRMSGLLKEKIIKKYNFWWKKLNITFQVLLVSYVVLHMILYVSVFESTFGVFPGPREFLLELGVMALYIIGARLCVFDYAHNKTFKERWDYVGTESEKDRLQLLFEKFMPPVFVLTLKFFILIVIFISMSQAYWIW